MHTSPIDLRAVLFDRDATLIVDVPYNGDPGKVQPMPTALEAVAKLRGEGIATGVVTNQSGIGRGLISRGQMRSVNSRVEDLLGPFDVWQYCPHGPDDNCECRKPRPGMILSAVKTLGVSPSQTAMIGDIGADMEAARAAGVHSVLVPTPVTRREEVAAAPDVVGTLMEAVSLLLSRAAQGSTL